MNRRLWKVIALTMALMLVFTSCASTPALTIPTSSTTASPTTGGTTVAPGSQDLMAGVKSAVFTSPATDPDPEIMRQIRRFAAALLKEASKNKGNVMVSPASVFLALAMTVNGADQQTRADMIKVLSRDGITVDQINQVSRNWIRGLEVSGGKTTLSIANSIWFRDSFDPDPAFLQANADSFDAGARQLDFSSAQAPDLINGWVDENTHGLIKKIIDKINPSTVMFLINTVYFKSDWLEPFEKAASRTRPFASPTGPVEVEFMHRIGPMNYFSGQMAAGDDVEGVALPYENGRFAYFAVLPPAGKNPREWLMAEDSASFFTDLAAFMAQKANFTVSLALPKYKAEFDDSLINELEALGMGIAFDGGRADFSLLSKSRSKGLYISEVKHKTFITVDEKGTEAAAATSVAIDESMPSYDKELVFDQPFLYGIMDLSTGVPLFAGILENPQG